MGLVRLASIGSVLATLVTAVPAFAEPPSTSKGFLEIGVSGAGQATPSLQAPNGMLASRGVTLEEAVVLGVSFTPSLVTRLRYARGSVELATVTAYGTVGGPPVGTFAMDDYRIEAAWRLGEGPTRLYLGVAAGYRRIGTVSYPVGPGFGGSFSLTPQGAISGTSMGILFTPHGGIGPYATLAASVDLSALHAQDVQPTGPPYNYLENYQVTPRLQAWLALRLEFGWDIDMDFAARSRP